MAASEFGAAHRRSGQAAALWGALAAIVVACLTLVLWIVQLRAENRELRSAIYDLAEPSEERASGGLSGANRELDALLDRQTQRERELDDLIEALQSDDDAAAPAFGTEVELRPLPVLTTAERLGRAGVLLVRLMPGAGSRAGSVVEVELLDAVGQVLWTGQGELDRRGETVLAVPGGFLQGSRFRFRVRSSAAESIEYDLALTEPAR